MQGQTIERTVPAQARPPREGGPNALAAWVLDSPLVHHKPAAVIEINVPTPMACLMTRLAGMLVDAETPVLNEADEFLNRLRG